MSIEYFPIEVLEIIFSHLSFADLKTVSSVCHRWNRASERIIIPLVKFNVTKPFQRTPFGSTKRNEIGHTGAAVVIENSRNYEAIAIASAMNELSEFYTTIAKCVQRYPNVSALYLKDFRCQDLHFFYLIYRAWMLECKSLHVSLRCRTYDYQCDGRIIVHFQTWPNLKELSWTECNVDHVRRITIEAPNLESLNLSSNVNLAKLNLQNCNQIRYFKYNQVGDVFPKTLVKCFHGVESLQLTNMPTYTDFRFVKNLNQLRHLEIDIKAYGNMTSMDAVINMCAGLEIRILKLSGTTSICHLDLPRIFVNLPALESLQLCHFDLNVGYEGLQAEHLKKLDLQSIRQIRSHGSIMLDIPNLTDLTIEDVYMNQIDLSRTLNLTHLCIVQKDKSIAHMFEDSIPCFLKVHKTVRCLTVIGKNQLGNDNLEESVYRREEQLNVQHLVLQGISIAVDFFRMVSEWRSLKSITLVGCTIDCDGLMDNEVIRLPAVDRIGIQDGVELKNTSRAGFPLEAGRIQIEDEYELGSVELI